MPVRLGGSFSYATCPSWPVPARSVAALQRIRPDLGGGPWSVAATSTARRNPQSWRLQIPFDRLRSDGNNGPSRPASRSRPIGGGARAAADRLGGRPPSDWLKPVFSCVPDVVRVAPTAAPRGLPASIGFLLGACSHVTLWLWSAHSSARRDPQLYSATDSHTDAPLGRAGLQGPIIGPS